MSFIRTRSPASSLSLRPPRQPSLCAPAVPLLWLQFVLLCFRMAKVEAAPTMTHPTHSVSLSLFLSLSPHAPKESERGGFCVRCRCLGWVKRGAEATVSERESRGRGCYSAWDPPPVAGLDPHRTFVVGRYSSPCG